MANTDSPVSTQADAKIAELAAKYYDDPYGFVMAFFPWGEQYLIDGTRNPLANKTGPEPWQTRLLKRLGEHIKEGGDLKSLGLDYPVWRSARASGHGIGKSAIVAWLIIFFMVTRKDTRGVVTANTQKQLEDKTWPELAKWHNMLICRHWFTWSATAYTFRLYPEEKQKNYRITASTVSEENTEAFAGLHNEGNTIVVIFDEGSGIASKIWEVAQGALTDGEGFFFAFGNPTRPDGAFFDCFDKYEHMYDLEHIDSRAVSHTNKSHINDILSMYGEDSDEAKIRVYGQFPNQAFNGFITREAVQEALDRELHADTGAALILSVDVARFGGDEIVFCYRQGRDARTRKQMIFGGMSNTRLAELVAQEADRTRPDAIVIENHASGVIDILKDKGYRVHEVHPGAPANDSAHHANRRAEMWYKCREWIYLGGGCMHEEPKLIKQLTSIQYLFPKKGEDTRTRIEPKEVYKSRMDGESPDRADALVLTFAVHIARRDHNLTRSANRRDTAVVDYDPVTY